MYGDGDEIEAPSRDEIEKIICRMKNGKASGANGITAELIKCGGNQLNTEVHKLTVETWRREEMPEAWREVPLHKKGDRTEKNYRGIALLDVMYKILATAIRDRLQTYTENNIGEYQCDFRKNRSVADQIFTVKELQAVCYEHNMDLHTMFIDFQRAYDSVSREALYHAMKELNVPNKIIRLVRMTMESSVSKVRVNNVISEPFESTVGLRQGDPLSTTLFNIILEKVIRDAGINRSGFIINKSHQCLAYADDITILTTTKQEMQRVVRILERKGREVGLRINEEKTKYMLMRRTSGRESQQKNIEIDLENNRKMKIEEVQNFTYLGVWLTKDGNNTAEIKARLVKGDKCAGALSKFLKSKSISRKAKLRIYKAILRPTITYGCETWVLNKKDIEMIEVWERKILRKIFGGKREGEDWRRRTNEELRQLYGEATITSFVKAQRIRWLGHIERREDCRAVKKVLQLKTTLNRRQGRPRRRWMKSVEEDLEKKSKG